MNWKKAYDKAAAMLPGQPNPLTAEENAELLRIIRASEKRHRMRRRIESWARLGKLPPELR